MIAKSVVAAGALIAGAFGSSGCAQPAQAMTPQSIEQQYGVSGAYVETIATPDGPIAGTTVPATLADGRTVQLFIPAKQGHQPHAVYVRDGEGLHPVRVRDSATRDEIAQAPAIERQAEPAHANTPSWEKDALIIGGSAGAGAVVGAVTAGKKGAGIGAAAGGVGGLIYDLVTRRKK